MLNNNRPEPMTAQLALFDEQGRQINVPDVALESSESKLIEMSASLLAAGVLNHLGYLRIHYSGRPFELGAQLTLYPTSHGGGLDSPRSVKSDTVSTSRHAVAWLPDASSGTIALTNVSDDPIEVAVAMNGHSEKITVAPRTTKLKRTEDEDNPTQNELLSFDANYLGDPSSLRVFGYISGPTGNLPVRIYDSSTASMQTLNAIGLLTSVETHAFIRNVSSAPAMVHPALVEVGNQSPFSLEEDAITIPPYESVALPLKDQLATFAARGVRRTTLLVRGGQKGQLVGSITQIVETGVLEDIPFRTGNAPRFMRGAYPLRWQKDYTNHPMVANTADQPLYVKAYVIAGGKTYNFPPTNLQPGTTMSYDVDSIRKNQTPDAFGTVIPLTATYGKFHWMPANQQQIVGLHGRTELASSSDQRASSFSCNFICDYEWQEYPIFDYFPWDDYATTYVTGAKIVHASKWTQDTYGNYFTDPVDSGEWGGITSSPTSVLSLTFVADYLRVDTGDIGAGTVSYWYATQQGQQSEDGSYCNYPDYGYQDDELVTVGGVWKDLVSGHCQADGTRLDLFATYGDGFGQACSYTFAVYGAPNAPGNSCGSSATPSHLTSTTDCINETISRPKASGGYEVCTKQTCPAYQDLLTPDCRSSLHPYPTTGAVINCH